VIPRRTGEGRRGHVPDVVLGEVKVPDLSVMRPARTAPSGNMACLPVTVTRSADTELRAFEGAVTERERARDCERR